MLVARRFVSSSGLLDMSSVGLSQNWLTGTDVLQEFLGAFIKEHSDRRIAA